MRSSTFFALLGGVAIGAALGVLFAPDKGSVTRKKIKEAVQDEYEDLKEMAEEKIEDLKEQTQEYVDKTKAKFQRKKQVAEEI